MGRMFACAATIALVGLASCDKATGPGTPVDLSYAQCVGATDNPTWFAVQDGGGSWQRVNASASGAFDFSISSGKAGVAMVTADGLFIVYATTDELKANFPACGGAIRAVSGSVTGYTAADNVRIAMGTNTYDVFGTQTPPATFSLTTVDAPVSDLIAVRHRTSAATSPTYEVSPNNVLFRRNLTGTSASTLDFSSAADAGAPVSRTVTVTNITAGDEVTVLSNIALKSTTANIAIYEAQAALLSGAVTAPFYGVPGARLTTGESQMIHVSAGRSVTANTHESRFMTSVFTDPSDRSMTLGPVLGNVALTGTSRPTATYTVQSGYDNLFDVVFVQGSGSNKRQVEVVATNSYLGGTTSVSLTVPNLAGVSGFSSNWLLVPGVATGWAFLATSADLALLTGKPITYQGGDRASVFTP